MCLSACVCVCVFECVRVCVCVCVCVCERERESDEANVICLVYPWFSGCCWVFTSTYPYYLS